MRYRILTCFSALLALVAFCGCSADLVNNPKLAYAALVDRESCVVSHWGLDENGGTAVDTKGPNEGTYVLGTSLPGITFQIPGPFFGFTNSATLFTAPAIPGSDLTNSGEIIFPYNESMHIAGSLSIESWIKVQPGSNNTTWNKVMWMGNNSLANVGPWGFEVWGSQPPYIYFAFHIALDTAGDGVARDIKCVSQTTLMDGNWHHMVGVYNTNGATDNDTLSFFVDGVDSPVLYYLLGGVTPLPSGSIVGGKLLGNSTVYDTTTNTGYGPLGVGLVIGSAWHNTALGQWFDGAFSDMAFYSCALPADHIANHYNQGKFGHH